MPRKVKTVDLTGDWADEILDLYRQGASDTKVKAYIIGKRGTFSNHLWNQWLREDANFAKTIETGRVLAQAWWEDKGSQVDNRSFNAALWFMNMKNRFGWRDDVKDREPVKIDLKVDFVQPKK